MVLAGVAMLLLALAAIGMVLASAGLQDNRDADKPRRTGDGEASRVPAVEEDHRGYLGRAVAMR
jgi:hypothetical protein